MPMDSVTEENVAKIMKECADVKKERDELEATTLEQLWLGELDALESAYDTYKAKREQIQRGQPREAADKKKATKLKTKVSKKAYKWI